MTKKKAIVLLLTGMLSAAILTGAFLTAGGKRPYKNLDSAGIVSATVRLIPPDRTVPIADTAELAGLLKDVVIYREDSSYTEYSGQGVIFTLVMADKTETSIMAYNPFLVIDGVGYQTKYQPCEALSSYANRLLERAETAGFTGDAQEQTFRATVLEAADRSVLVEPAEGSLERGSADVFRVPNEENPTLQIGDTVEIAYNGDILESYPAQLGEVYQITLLTPAGPDAPGDRTPMVRVDGKLYCDTGRESTVVGRCGLMDGEITSTVDRNEIPAEDGQSNFGSGFGYQYGTGDTLEVLIDGKWFVFRCREDAE